MPNQFTAINGEEFKKILLSSISSALEDSGEFRNHVTFPLIQWNFKLECKIVPRQALDTDPEVVVEGNGARVSPDFSADELKNQRRLEINGEDFIDTPDLAREQAGIGIPTPVVGPDGSIEDKPVVSRREPEAKKMAVIIDRPSLAKDPPRDLAGTDVDISEPDVPVGRNEPARSVSIATRANPEGTIARVKK